MSGGSGGKSGAREGGPQRAQAQEQVEKCDPKILELLVCPLSKKHLEYDEGKQELVSRTAGLAFPIKDGIPIMLVDHARQLDDDGPLAR